jgi:hypothetical protein
MGIGRGCTIQGPIYTKVYVFYFISPSDDCYSWAGNKCTFCVDMSQHQNQSAIVQRRKDISTVKKCLKIRPCRHDQYMKP